jgi:c-di-AMP phosphodiesterase-like protein
LEFYGGRTRAIQKRTKVRSRVIGNELIRLMRESSNILVMGHRNEDFDALGACVGIARMAMYLGKQVRIVANEEDENLALCFETLYAIPEYKKIFVSGVDAQELVQSGTLLVIVDVNRGAQFAAPDLADAVQRRVVIDHHRKSGDSKHEFLISYIEPSASSACELVTELIEQTLPAATLRHEEADVMYSGIVLDTKQFKHNIGVRTFSSAMFLRNEGADPEKAQALFKTNLADFQRLSKFEEDVLIYRGVCAISVYDGDDADDNDRVAAAKVADRLLSLRHVQASFVLCRIDNVICVSARSEGMWNVQSILERLGGGGHFDAAGAQLRGVTMEQAKEKLQEAINIHINQM